METKTLDLLPASSTITVNTTPMAKLKGRHRFHPFILFCWFVACVQVIAVPISDAGEKSLLQLAAMSTKDGPNGATSPLGCKADGICNAGECAADPDCPAGVGNKNHPKQGQEDTLKLNIQFNITKTAGPDETQRNAAVTKTEAWIAEAEKMYTRSPRLKITASYRFNTLDVPTSFKNTTAAHKWLKDNYDNVRGDTKTDGALVVVVMHSGVTLTHKEKDACDNNGFGGLSFFPDSLRPFARKHGIALDVHKADASFAHELGHMFGLKHSFDGTYGLAKNCNKDLSKQEYGTREGSKVNLMDHGLRNGDQAWLNSCQTDKAADHRKRLQTKDGKTNYNEL